MAPLERAQYPSCWPHSCLDLEHLLSCQISSCECHVASQLTILASQHSPWVSAQHTMNVIENSTYQNFRATCSYPRHSIHEYFRYPATLEWCTLVLIYSSHSAQTIYIAIKQWFSAAYLESIFLHPDNDSNCRLAAQPSHPDIASDYCQLILRTKCTQCCLLVMSSETDFCTWSELLEVRQSLS